MFVYDVLDNGKVTKVDFDEIYEYVRRDKISKKQFREYISGLYSHVNGRLDTLTTLVNSVKVAHESDVANTLSVVSNITLNIQSEAANANVRLGSFNLRLDNIETKITTL